MTVVVAATEAAALEVVGGAEALAPEEPVEGDLGAAVPLQPGCDRDRLLGGVLHVDLEVVLQVGADAREVVDHLDAERREVRGVADARELEQLRGVDGAAAEHDLAGLDAAPTAGVPVVEADRALAPEPDAGDEGERLDAQVGARPRRIEVGPGRRPAATPVDVAVEAGEALLPVAVDVVGQREAGLLGGLEEHPEQRVGGRAALEQQRAVGASPGVTGRAPGVVEAGLHPLEVRQAVQVVPRLQAGVGRPPLEVHRVAALEDHAVDRAAAAQDLAARVVDPPVVHVRLGVGLVLPVVEPVADRERQRRGHVDQRVEAGVRVPRLEHEHGRRPGRRSAGWPARCPPTRRRR